MLQRTKIIATLGPACAKREVLQPMLAAGVDVVRVNFSHGTDEDHAKLIELARDCAEDLGKEIAVLADLQGPKIRIARFREQEVFLETGDSFTLDAAMSADAGTKTSVGIDYKALPNDVKAGDILLLDDGRVVLDVINVNGTKIVCVVKVGGRLSNNKGINRFGGGLSAKALTAKDRADLKIAVKLNADYIAISFPRSAEDILEARKLLNESGSQAGIVAKIERTEAVHALEEIIRVSDAIMVARGDLGVEIGDAELPAVQKRIIHLTREMNKTVITATQMMDSMITSPLPTRAEVFDVANAVLDGTDAVMLSAETATGAYPVAVIEAVARICRGAERHRIAQISRHRMERQFNRSDEAIAMATMYTANHLNIKAIIALTESGSTPLWMSRIRSGIPIYALTPSQATQRRVCLYRGVYPVKFNIHKMLPDEVNQRAIGQLQKADIVKDGDLVIITRGDLLGVGGHTNMLKIVQVGNSISR